MLKSEDLTHLQALVARIGERLASLPNDGELRYAYRLAAAHALSLSDQLEEIRKLQAQKFDDDMQLAS